MMSTTISDGVCQSHGDPHSGGKGPQHRLVQYIILDLSQLPGYVPGPQ